MRTVFSDLSLDVDVADVEALKTLVGSLDDAFVIHSILTQIAGLDDRSGYRGIICTLTPKIVDPVVLVHCVGRGVYDGLGEDLEMTNAVLNRIGAFRSTPSCLALIASHFLDMDAATSPQRYEGRVIDTCLQALPEGLVYELAVKHGLPAGKGFWLLAPYLNAAHRAEMLCEVTDMEKAWWLIRNQGGLTHLAEIKNAVKDQRVRQALDSYLHSSTIEE